MFIENLYRLRDAEGKRLEYLVNMLEHEYRDAGQEGRFYKHIGDYSLFMLGMFPEFLRPGAEA